jgi:hypothetical protein
MRISRPVSTVLSALSGSLVLSAAILMPAGSANAAVAARRPAVAGGSVQPQACAPDKGYSFQSVNNHYHVPVGIEYKSGPGGTVHASIQNSLSVAASVGGSGEVSGSAVIASAKLQLNTNLTVTASISQTYTYDHAVANGSYGHLQFGNWGYWSNWTLSRTNGNCTETPIGWGTAVIPTVNVWGYNYWETSY